MKDLFSAQVIAAYGRQYLVRMGDGSMMICMTRGKRSEVACGDYVEVRRTDRPSVASGALPLNGIFQAAQGVIELVRPRRSLLHRSNAYREKIIAANVTQIIVVVAVEPTFNDELLARCLVAAFDQKLAVLIVLNKCDLLEGAVAARERLKSYSNIGYRVLELSAKQDASRLRPFLTGHSSVLVGQSGMGKSTLINALLPDAQAVTREISSALNSGKHTTTHARLYHLDDSSSLIDCPGVQAFGLHHLSFGGIEQGFVEFAPYLGQCRFHDCHHLHEPGCALRCAVEAGKIDTRRLELFQTVTAELH